MRTVWTRAVKVRFGVGILILQASGHRYQLYHKTAEVVVWH